MLTYSLPKFKHSSYQNNVHVLFLIISSMFIHFRLKNVLLLFFDKTQSFVVVNQSMQCSALKAEQKET